MTYRQVSRGGRNEIPPRRPPPKTYYRSFFLNDAARGFHYSRAPPQKAQARRFAPLTATGHCAFGYPPCCGVIARAVFGGCSFSFSFVLGVFSLLSLASFGSGALVVRFVFRWAGDLGCVFVRCPSRSAVARLLLRFRRARRWWRSSAAPPRSAASWGVPRFGLRFVARFPCAVAVPRLSSRGGGLRVFRLPAGRVARPCPSGCLLFGRSRRG